MISKTLLVYLSLLTVMNEAQSFTLTGGYHTLPKGLYGSFVAVNSQNEVIIIGGCDAYTQCANNDPILICNADTQRSSAIYVWSTQHSSMFVEAQTPTPDIAAWNPSSGYPFPIHQDIMYIPWNNVMHKYDTTNKQWLENTTSTMPIDLSYPCTVYDKAEYKIYLLGGSEFKSGQLIFYSTVQIYDITTDSWKLYLNTPQMPLSVYGGSCVLLGRAIYHFGGRVDDMSVSNAVFKYNIDANYWTQIYPDIGQHTFGVTAIAANDDYIFLFGGAQIAYRGSCYRYTDPSSNVYLFKTNTDSSTLITNMINPRFAPLAALVHDRIWIAGGYYWDTASVETEISLEVMNGWSYSPIPTTTTTTTTTTAKIPTTSTSTVISNKPTVTSTTTKANNGQQTELDTTNSAAVHSVSSDKYAASDSNNDGQNNEGFKIAIGILSISIVFLLVILLLVYKYIQENIKKNVAKVNEPYDAIENEENKQSEQVNKYKMNEKNINIKNDLGGIQDEEKEAIVETNNSDFYCL